MTVLYIVRASADDAGSDDDCFRPTLKAAKEKARYTAAGISSRESVTVTEVTLADLPPRELLCALGNRSEYATASRDVFTIRGKLPDTSERD